MKSSFDWLEVFRRAPTEPPAIYPLRFHEYPFRMHCVAPISDIVNALSRLAQIDSKRSRLKAPSQGLDDLAMEAEAMRASLPAAVLAHYDLLQSKGKQGAARVRDGVCGGCHLALPSNQRCDLIRDNHSLHVCGYCGVFLLPELPVFLSPVPGSAKV